MDSFIWFSVNCERMHTFKQKHFVIVPLRHYYTPNILHEKSTLHIETFAELKTILFTFKSSSDSLFVFKC